MQWITSSYHETCTFLFPVIATGTLDAMGVCTGEDVAGAPVSYKNDRPGDDGTLRSM